MEPFYHDFFYYFKESKNLLCKFNLSKNVILSSFLVISWLWDLIETRGFPVDNPNDHPDNSTSPHLQIQFPESFGLKSLPVCQMVSPYLLKGGIVVWGTPGITEVLRLLPFGNQGLHILMNDPWSIDSETAKQLTAACCFTKFLLSTLSSSSGVTPGTMVTCLRVA